MEGTVLFVILSTDYFHLIIEFVDSTVEKKTFM